MSYHYSQIGTTQCGPTFEYRVSMTLRLVITTFLMFQTCFLGQFASAKINIKKTKRLVMPAKIQYQPLAEVLTPEIIPSDIKEGDSGEVVLTKMADKGLAMYWNNSPMRHSSAGRAVEAAEKKLNLQAEYRDENKVQHKINFKVMAVQALAKIQYTGWVNAALNYDLKAARAEAEVSEPLSDKKDLVLSHEVKSGEQKSAVSLKWKW